MTQFLLGAVLVMAATIWIGLISLNIYNATKIMNMKPAIFNMAGETGVHKITGHKVRILQDHNSDNTYGKLQVRVYPPDGDYKEVVIPTDEIKFDKPSLAGRGSL